MLQITDEATAVLSAMGQEQNLSEDESIRLIASENGLGLQTGQIADADTTFEHDGQVVLLVDQQLAAALESHKLDVEQTEQGVGLSLKPQEDD